MDIFSSIKEISTLLKEINRFLSKGMLDIYLKHGIIIRAGITCKKTPCYKRNSACRWCIVKKAKIFVVMLNIFILAGVRKCRILIGLCK